jgi:type VI secretion system protein ImpA
VLESDDLDQREVPTRTAPDQARALEPASSSPRPEAESCGPDLDAQGDADYLNFFAHVEGILPTSFFSPEDGKPFDSAAFDVDDQRAILKTLQARTRDIRLAAIEARLAALKRDIEGFAAAVATIADWLERSWDHVHPRPEGVDLEARRRALGGLDLPTVVFPLQYSPLFEARRIGTVTYRRWLIATGEARPREGDAEAAASALAQALDEVDEPALAAIRGHLARLDDALRRISAAFAAHGSAADLSTLSALVVGMRAFLGRGAQGSDTLPAEAQDGNATLAAKPDGPAFAAGPPPASIADATLALAAIADYYGRREPSSPVLPLVRQARELVGKSFLEIVTILVPSQADKAAFQIGTDQVFDLPLGKLSSLPPATGPGPASGSEQASGLRPDEAGRPQYRVESRSQAIALLESVQSWFRVSEPSSPVPMLCARARAMAERDFMTLLRDVLPKAALRNVNADK